MSKRAIINKKILLYKWFYGGLSHAYTYLSPRADPHIHSAHVPLFAHIQTLEIYYFIINPYYYVGRYDDS